MNSDIDNIYQGSKQQKSANAQKKAQINAEKRLKESVTARPFNLGILKNANNIARDESSNSQPRNR